MNVGTGSYCPSCFERVRSEGTLQAALKGITTAEVRLKFEGQPLIDVQVSEQGNRVEVRTIVPRPRNFPGAVDYTITVPADAKPGIQISWSTKPACDVKPVMTDEEIERCKKAR